jgi:hypothetical protein
MLIAKEKRKTNIVEYILYMWQMEDLIRAMEFNMEKLDQQLVSKYNCNEGLKKEIYDWYKNLIVMMQKEHVEKSGHLQIIKNTLAEVNEFHLMLLKSGEYPQYDLLYNKAKPDVEMLASKDKSGANEIELVLNAIYGVLLLKMKGTDISKGTLEAVKIFSSFLAHLADSFKKYEEGQIEI